MKSLAAVAGLLAAGLALRSVANARRCAGVAAARRSEWNDPTWRAELAALNARTIVGNVLPHRKGT